MSSFHLTNELISILKLRLIIFELETEGRRNLAQCRHLILAETKNPRCMLMSSTRHTMADKCRLNWWLNCTKKFSMNPIEILEILAIAVHRFREMLGLGPDFGQLSAGQCRLQPDSRPHIRITPILTKQKKNQRKLPEQVIVSWPDRSSRAPVSAGKLGLFLCCIEPAAELWRA